MLDLCCGSGDLAFLLSEKVGPNGKVCSSDLPFTLLFVSLSNFLLKTFSLLIFFTLLPGAGSNHENILEKTRLLNY